jgi:hypothetical protein
VDVREADEIVWLPRGFEFLSGLPDRKRRKRGILAYQAWIDDSGGKGVGKVLLLGGLFGTADAMASLADQWDRELRAHVPLPIGFFKSYEASHLTGQFLDWSEDGRNQKVLRLARLLNRDDLTVLFVCVDLASHKQMESIVGGPIGSVKRHGYSQPYLLAHTNVMMAVAQEMRSCESTDRIEVIFDEQFTYRKEAKQIHDDLRANAPDWLRPYLPIEPFFRDDHDFVVLQAADMLMGEFRMRIEETQRWPTIELDRLRLSPFCKKLMSHEQAEITAKAIADRLGVPRSSVKFAVLPPTRD